MKKKIRRDRLDVPNCIRTFTGAYINVFDPNLDDIYIEDGAHAMSMQCRFGGHTKEFYSVAQHSMWVAERVPDRLKLAALLHDMPEAYLVDIPKPIKKGLDDYNKVEHTLMIAIATKFKFEYPFHKLIKKADRAALKYEWKNKVLNNTFKSMTPSQAKKAFLKKFKEYSKLSEKYNTNPTTLIIREAMQIVSKEVRSPKVVRKGIVSPMKK